MDIYIYKKSASYKAVWWKVARKCVHLTRNDPPVGVQSNIIYTGFFITNVAL